MGKYKAKGQDNSNPNIRYASDWDLHAFNEGIKRASAPGCTGYRSQHTKRQSLITTEANERYDAALMAITWLAGCIDSSSIVMITNASDQRFI